MQLATQGPGGQCQRQPLMHCHILAPPDTMRAALPAAGTLPTITLIKGPIPPPFPPPKPPGLAIPPTPPPVPTASTFILPFQPYAIKDLSNNNTFCKWDPMPGHPTCFLRPPAFCIPQMQTVSRVCRFLPLAAATARA
jgi:hypothetical protein